MSCSFWFSILVRINPITGLGLAIAAIGGIMLARSNGGKKGRCSLCISVRSMPSSLRDLVSKYYRNVHATITAIRIEAGPFPGNGRQGYKTFFPKKPTKTVFTRICKSSFKDQLLI
jgi:hypothetical protein